MLYVFLALALLSGCALTYAASGFASLAAVWQVPVFFLGSFLALVVLFLLVFDSCSTSSAGSRWRWAASTSM